MMEAIPLQPAPRQLHAAEVESLEERIMQVALEQTGSENGAIFLWDGAAGGLGVDFHVVRGVTVPLPGVVFRKRRDGRPNGIPMRVFEVETPYLCNDTGDDPHYARYFQDVGSVAAAPVLHRGRAIGVIAVSATGVGAYTAADVEALVGLANASARSLRRAQLARAYPAHQERRFLIKGLSPEWLEAERRVERVASTQAPVLLQGESGTGRASVARAIHALSPRFDRPFVVVNCGAVPEATLEAVLFGHPPGASPGSSFDRRGEFRRADGGTLFLDEVGALPTTLQPQVLGAIERGEVRSPGDARSAQRVDVRLIGATTRDLRALVRAGHYRDDLLYRLSTTTIDLPALRTYKDKLDVLVHAFLRQARHRHGKKTHRVAPEAMAALHSYDYPGNLRELKAAIEHAAILARGEEIRLGDLPTAIAQPRPEDLEPTAQTHRTLHDLRASWIAPLERRYLAAILDECGGNVRAAAARAGIHSSTLYRLMQRRRVRPGRRQRKKR